MRGTFVGVYLKKFILRKELFEKLINFNMKKEKEILLFKYKFIVEKKSFKKMFFISINEIIQLFVKRLKIIIKIFKLIDKKKKKYILFFEKNNEI